jgi:predicted enzyme related to lactoylglutathione lyase
MSSRPARHHPARGSRQAELRGPCVRTIIMVIRRRQEDRMRARRIMANLRVADIEAAKSFYTDFLGLTTEEFNMGWVARYTSPDTGANVQLVTRDATAAEDSVISVQVADVDAAYEQAQRLGYEIVHPLTTEPWGVRRFFVRAPDGNVINIARHRD